MSEYPPALLDGVTRVSGRKSTGGEHVLLALAVILLVIAVVGGIAVHPLLFLTAVLAILALVAGRR